MRRCLPILLSLAALFGTAGPALGSGLVSAGPADLYAICQAGCDSSKWVYSNSSTTNVALAPRSGRSYTKGEKVFLDYSSPQSPYAPIQGYKSTLVLDTATLGASFSAYICRANGDSTCQAGGRSVSATASGQTLTITLTPGEIVRVGLQYTAATGTPDVTGIKLQAHIGFWAVDSQAPELSLTASDAASTSTLYSAGDAAENGLLSLQVGATDNTLIDPASRQLTIDGQAADPDRPPALTEGRHEVSFSACDLASYQGQPNCASLNRTISFDATAPQATLGDRISANTQPTLLLSASDPVQGGFASGLRSEQIILLVDGQRTPFTLSQSSLGLMIALGTPLRDGAHSVAVMVSDQAGNTAISPEAQLLIDTQAPQISGISPAPDQQGVDPQSAVEALVSDDGAGVAKARLLVDGRQAALPDGSGTLSYTTARGLAPGLHKARVEVEDEAGNSASYLWSFRVGYAPDPGDGKQQSARLSLNAATERTGTSFTVRASGVLTGAHARKLTLELAGPRGTFKPLRKLRIGKGGRYRASVRLRAGSWRIRTVARLGDKTVRSAPLALTLAR